MPCSARRRLRSSSHNRRSDQQPGREFSSPGTAKRTTDAAIQISWCRATISLNPRRYLQHFQRPASSDLTQNNATAPSGSHGQVGCHDCCGVKLGSLRPSTTEPCLCDSTLRRLLAPRFHLSKGNLLGASRYRSHEVVVGRITVQTPSVERS